MSLAFDLWIASVLFCWIFAGYGIYTSEVKSRSLLVCMYLGLVLNVTGFLYFITYENL